MSSVYLFAAFFRDLFWDFKKLNPLVIAFQQHASSYYLSDVYLPNIYIFAAYQQANKSQQKNGMC